MRTGLFRLFSSFFAVFRAFSKIAFSTKFIGWTALKIDTGCIIVICGPSGDNGFDQTPTKSSVYGTPSAFFLQGPEANKKSSMLYFLGLNLRRLPGFYKTGKQLSFWSAPKDLVPEIFKKPSAKRLSQKGKRINEKTMQEKKKK